MRRSVRWGLGIGLALCGIGAIGWIYRFEILLTGVEIAMARRLPVGPNQPISWSTGPDPRGRAPAERPPNVVLILADDLGWNDLRFAGGGVADGSVPTPHIDSIAAAGVTFTRGYAANATCAPSRAALLISRRTACSMFSIPRPSRVLRV
jgi:hypothetical protein